MGKADIKVIAKTLKSYPHEKEATGFSRDSPIASLFKMETSLKLKNLHPEGANSFL